MQQAGPIIVLVGGYLGSGKTTLLLQAAARLSDSGVRVALITNDQGGALVDTRLATAAGNVTEEISGGCFCCRFSEFVNAADRLSAFDPEVILAEPVGSCIDISATVLQPIKRHYSDRYRLAPFTVLVDPQRARELLAADANPYLAYLFTNQIGEADLVCYSKADLYADFPVLPGGFALRLSAKTGQGVPEWLAEVLAGSKVAGSRLLEVDYQKYAEAEAALGWLNWQANLQLSDPLSPLTIIGPFLDDLDERLARAGVDIAHLKVLDQASTGYIKASLCRSGDEPTVDGHLTASPALRHELLLNLRAPAAPELLREIVRQAAESLPGDVMVLHSETFRPSPPKPEIRLGTIE
jgi:hypothetical protein